MRYVPGKFYRIDDVLYLKEEVCLMRIEGDYKITYFECSVPEEYRREYASSSERMMWAKLEKVL